METGDECQTDDDQKPKPQRQRRPFYDREKIEYAKELIENGLSNKEMSMLLELSIANVRKLKVNILKGTINELIDDSAEHYSNLKGNSDLVWIKFGVWIVPIILCFLGWSSWIRRYVYSRELWFETKAKNKFDWSWNAYCKIAKRPRCQNNEYSEDGWNL